MTRIEYDLLRKERSDLRLPLWVEIDGWQPTLIARLKTYSREEVIALRTARLLSREHPEKGL